MVEFWAVLIGAILGSNTLTVLVQYRLSMRDKNDEDGELL